MTAGLLGIAAYYPSNPAVEFATLSREFAWASPAERDVILAAGKALLVAYAGTSFTVYYVLSAIALIVFAAGILRTRLLSAATGGWGLAAGVLMVVPSSIRPWGTTFALASLVPWSVFVVLLVIQFRALTHSPAATNGATAALAENPSTS